jgi:hypothetical protein
MNPQYKMLYTKKDKRGILNLPNELLYRVLELSRPEGFEHAILTCKHIYNVAKNLIIDHKFCKFWLWCEKGPKHAGHVHIECPIKFLHQISLVPSRTLFWLWKYLKHIVIYEHVCVQACRELLDEIKNDKPRLIQDVLLRMAAQFPDTLPFSNLFEDDPFDSFKICPNASLFDVAILTFLPNLQMMALHAMPTLDDHITIPDLIRRDRGNKHFQQLKEVHLGVGVYANLKEISPWLLLPKLKTLIVIGLSERENSSGVEEKSENLWPKAEVEPGLEQLVLLNACAEPERVARFLEPLKSLRTFIWQDEMDNEIILDDRSAMLEQESYNENNDEEHTPNKSLTDQTKESASGVMSRKEVIEKDETMRLQTIDANGVVRTGNMSYEEKQRYCEAMRGKVLTVEQARESWKPLVEYDSDEKEDAPEDLEPESWLWQPGEESPTLWSPKDLVDYLLLSHGDKLKHLALTINLSNQDEALIKRRDRITDFKNFAKLTRLELDSDFLRPIKGSDLQIPPYGIPRSLADILPPSIKVVHLTIRYGQFQNIHRMLRKIPSTRSKFPHLKRIVVRFADMGAPFETMTRIQLLRAEIEKVGIRLDLDEMNQFWDLHLLGGPPVVFGRGHGDDDDDDDDDGESRLVAPSACFMYK